MKKYFLKGGIKRLLSGTILVTLALIVNAAFSYLLQLYLGRRLSIEDYGTFNALLSLFYIFSVPASVLGLSLVKISSDLVGENKYAELTKLFWDLSKKVVIFGLFIVLFLYLFSTNLAQYFNISDPRLFAFLGLYVLGSLLVVPPQSYLRGLLMFNKFAVYAVVSGALRLTVPVAFVYLGYRVGGVYAGLFVALVLTYLFAVVQMKDKFKKVDGVQVNKFYKNILRFSLPVLLMHLGLVSLTNLDVVLVKKYLSGVDAGYYAGVVTLGKIILFGAGSVSMVMFPEISALKSAGKEYMSRFKFFVILQLGVLAAGVIVYTFLPRFITMVFFGEQFINSVQYLPLFSIFIALYVFSNFMVQFFLAIDKTIVFVFLLLPITVQFVLLSINHKNLYQVINANIVATLILLVSLLIYLYKITKDVAPV